MLRFGQDEPIFGNVRLDGNIGVRFVHDNLSSAGQLGVQSAQQLGLASSRRLANDPATLHHRSDHH